jgi:glycosyltransferase involved in cell wall biosynthesis
MQKRIFIGFKEIANFTNTYKKGFEAIGHKTYTVVDAKSIFYPNAVYDVVLSELFLQKSASKNWFLKILKKLISVISIRYFFFKALFKCDIFYYITGGNVLPFQLDYSLIKLLGKKLVVVFLGSEIRHWYLYNKDLENKGYDKLFSGGVEAYRNQPSTFIIKYNRVKSAEKYADLVLSQAGFGQLQTKPYSRATVGLNLTGYSIVVPNRRVPIIVHAPSSRGIKGTSEILAALDCLKNEGYEFKFRLIENMSNDELIQLLVESDIVVDELNSDTIGMLSAEAMATGNAVLTSYIADWAQIPLPCPVLNTNVTNVYENIKMLINDIDLRARLAEEGRRYVEKNNNILDIVQRELAFLETPLSKRQYDFIPETHLSALVAEALSLNEQHPF